MKRVIGRGWGAAPVDGTRGRESRRGSSIVQQVSLVVALVAVMLPIGSSPALADDFAPQLISFHRVSSEVLGSEQAVLIEFTARDPGPAGLAYAMFTFSTPLGAELRVDSIWMNRASEGTFIATQKVGVWAASGDYALEKIEVLDREWNRTTYDRGGAGFDFSSADFSVRNPFEDTTTPTISSARLFQTDVAQGTPAVIIYGAEDHGSGVSRVSVSGFSPTGGNYHLESLPRLGAAGPATWVVPLGAAKGKYDTILVEVIDRAGNMTHYQANGETSQYPPGATLPDHSPPNLDALDFTVHGATEDRVPPMMTTFSRLTPEVRRLGDLVAVDFTAFDQGIGIREVSAGWTDPMGHVLDASKTCGDRSHGPLSVTIEDYRTIGSEWKLNFIGFVDYLGNQTAYMRDGSVQYQNGESGQLVHSFDLSQGDFRIEAGAPSVPEFEDTTRHFCPVVGQVGLGVGDTDLLFGEPVTVTGDVRRAGSAIADPLVAIHQFVGGRPRLIDVVTGGPGGEYSETFTPTESGAVAATFLGSAGPGGADAASSSRVKFLVRPAIAASLGAEKIELGARTTLRGSITPSGLGGDVLLQRRTREGWRTERTADAGSGQFSFRVRPRRAGTLYYRVVKPPTGTLAAGRSSRQTLLVTRS